MPFCSEKRSVCLQQRTFIQLQEKNPYSIYTGNVESLKNMRVFGCRAFVLGLPPRSKFETGAVKVSHLETLDHGIY